jgi:Cu/Ag efflux protein CusF
MRTKMRNFALPLVLVAALSASSLAFAATPSTVEGTIKAIDAKADTITLDNGAIYHLAKTIKIAAFKVGEKVKITFEQNGTMLDASAVIVE